jgi:hypothetical protein
LLHRDSVREMQGCRTCDAMHDRFSKSHEREFWGYHAIN